MWAAIVIRRFGRKMCRIGCFADLQCIFDMQITCSKESYSLLGGQLRPASEMLLFSEILSLNLKGVVSPASDLLERQ